MAVIDFNYPPFPFFLMRSGRGSLNRNLSVPHRSALKEDSIYSIPN